MNNKRKVIAALVCTALLIEPCLVLANPGQYLASFNGALSVPPGTYETTGAFHFQGGTFQWRVPVESTSSVYYDPITVDGSCSGLDVNFGGFGFAQGQEIIKKLRMIAQNAEAFFYSLSMEALSPLVASANKWIETQMSALNGLSGDTCTAGQDIATWAGKQAGQKISAIKDNSNCMKKAINEGQVPDIAGATPLCQSDSKILSTINSLALKMASAPGPITEAKKLLGEKVDTKKDISEDVKSLNITYRWLVRQNFTMAEIREVMSIIGIRMIVNDVPDERVASKNLTAYFENIYKADTDANTDLKVAMYKCDEEAQCLNPKIEQSVDISNQMGYFLRESFNELEKSVTDYSALANDKDGNEKKLVLSKNVEHLLKMMEVNGLDSRLYIEALIMGHHRNAHGDVAVILERIQSTVKDQLIKLLIIPYYSELLREGGYLERELGKDVKLTGDQGPNEKAAIKAARERIEEELKHPLNQESPLARAARIKAFEALHKDAKLLTEKVKEIGKVRLQTKRESMHN